MTKTNLRSELKKAGVHFTATEFKAITKEEMQVLLTASSTTEESTEETIIEEVVPVGDFSSDKLVIVVPTKEEKSTQKELLEQAILATVRQISFEATYNQAPVRYVKTKSLFTAILNKVSIMNHPKYASFTKAQKIEMNQNRVKAVITGLIKEEKLTVCKGRDFYALKF